MPFPSSSSARTPYLLYIVFITTLGPFQFGYHLAELNAPEAVLTCTSFPSAASAKNGLLNLPSCIPMSKPQFGLVSSTFTLGGLLGALVAGHMATQSGHLLTMRLTTLSFALGAIFESLAPSVATITCGRFISGIGAGVATVVVPMYVSEVAPPGAKGVFGASTQIMVNLGILVALTLGYFWSYKSMWRAIFAMAGIIGVLQGLGLFIVPESPEWLAHTGELEMARRVLQRIRGTATYTEEEIARWSTGGDSIAEEQSLLNALDDQPHSPARTHPKPHIGIFSVLTYPVHLRAIFAIVGVMLAQQLCGINAIVMYSVSILSELLPTWAGLITVGVAGLNLVMSLACAPLADRLGRKTCLMLSIAGMGTNALLIALGIMFSIKTLSAIAIMLFVASFAVGLGPVPFILANELVGPEAVGAAQSWGLAANWSAAFLVAQFFPMLNSALGKGRVFFVFAALAAAFFSFVAFFVPESKGKKDADEVWGRVRRQD